MTISYRGWYAHSNSSIVVNLDRPHPEQKKSKKELKKKIDQEMIIVIAP